MPTTPDLRRLLAVLAVGLVARAAVIAPGFGGLSDPDHYLVLARSLAEGRGFCLEPGKPTAYRPPLYPILLAPIVAGLDADRLPFGVAALHIVLGLGAIALTYLTARRWGYGPGRATLAAGVVALDPVALVQSRAVMTEPLAVLLVAACLAASTIRGRLGAVVSGVAFGLSGLCRPSLLPGAGLVAAAMLVVGEGGRGRRAGLALLFSIGVAATIAPWALRNAVRLGQPIATTTHGGHTLALANNPAYYADVLDGPPEAVWSGPNQAAWFAWVARSTAGMSEPESDRFLRDEGLRMLVERPGTFLRATVARLGRFWGVAPAGAVYARGLRLATAAWTVPLWVALALGLARRGAWRWPSVAAPLAVIALTAVHTVYWTDMRMRVPVIAAIGLIAAGMPLPVWKMGDGGGNSAGQTGGKRYAK